MSQPLIRRRPTIGRRVLDEPVPEEGIERLPVEELDDEEEPTPATRYKKGQIVIDVYFIWGLIILAIAFFIIGAIMLLTRDAKFQDPLSKYLLTTANLINMIIVVYAVYQVMADPMTENTHGSARGSVYVIVAFVAYLAVSTLLNLSHGGIDPVNIVFWSFATVLVLLWLFYLTYQVDPFLSYLLLIPILWNVYIVYEHSNIPTEM